MSKFAESGFRRKRNMFFCYITFLLLWSASFLLMPIASKQADKNMLLTYIAGSMFWLGALCTLLSALTINSSRKKSKTFMEQNAHVKQLGLIHFFKNKEAMVADIVLIVSVFGFVVARIWIKPNIVTFIFMALCLFSFGMHCMLNGVNYIYIQTKGKRGK